MVFPTLARFARLWPHNRGVPHRPRVIRACLAALFALVAALPAGAAPVATEAWQVGPGLTYAAFDRTDDRGTVRVHVLTARWTQTGLVLDQVSPDAVASRAALLTMVGGDRGVAGVNGDFFDIGVTNAPLGVAKDRQRGVLHGPRTGRTLAFVITSTGVPDVRRISLVGSVRPLNRPRLTLTNKNSPEVAVDGIGLYTTSWGGMPGPDVVGAASVVRQVVVDDGRVVANRATLSAAGKPMVGRVLIGRGDGALALAGLRVGTMVRVGAHLSVPVQMAMGGGDELLRDGSLVTSADVLAHPRTAIGIDRDRHLLHLVTVDGRSESSSGYTLLQLARLMRSLGDEDAMNLDGGGSSEMVAKGPDVGPLEVRNAPSDGHERLVANGLVFRYVG